MSMENPEFERQPGEFLLGDIRGLHETGEGTGFLEVHTTATNMSEGRLTEYAESTGGFAVFEDGTVSPGGRNSRGRVLVGFSRWRSSWDPKAPKGDPNLN